MDHEHFMRRCLELALEGRGMVGNGALVGAVLVRQGTILAKGFYASFGTHHAERTLLERFSGDVLPDDVFYVNLEPCCHYGKTPPCTEIILQRGVQHVVIGMPDPDPRVSGKGIAALRASGVAVAGPVLRAECEYFNRGFTSLRTKGRPWITLKRAQTRSGAIAHIDGSPRKITDAEQDAFAHRSLRARHDAVLVGVETIIRDNPFLTARTANKKIVQPWRLVLDPRLRTPRTVHLLTDDHRTRTILVTSPESANSPNAKEIRRCGVRAVPVPHADGRFSWNDLWQVIAEPHDDFPGIASVLVEGGQRTWDAFRSAGMFDQDVILSGV